MKYLSDPGEGLNKRWVWRVDGLTAHPIFLFNFPEVKNIMQAVLLGLRGIALLKLNNKFQNKKVKEKC